MKKNWNVIINFKNGDQTEYIYQGSREEARTDAYLSCPYSSIKNVIVTEREE